MDPVQAPLPGLPCRLRDAWAAELPHASGVVRLLLRGLVTCFGPLTSVEGAERLAGLPEPAIFALNHNSTFECFAAPATCCAAAPASARSCCGPPRRSFAQVMSEIARLSGKHPEPVPSRLVADRRAS